MNPILPRKYFVPDGEAHVMSDGRLYLYGSLDISGNDGWCSKEYRVFSTDDEKLENWVDHGISFSNTKDKSDVPWCPDTDLYAPDAIEKDGKVYLYFCGANGFEGVAVAESPKGPFTNAKPINIANGDGIDPSVFIDDDGQAYYFWGQFDLRGAKLCDDMCTIDESTINRTVLSEQEHGFHEGSSIRKRGDKYYIVYSDTTRGKATCLSYAMSEHPLGPYKRYGVVIDNVHCDPKSWNNHGSIECFKGQWYVFYHRSSQNSMTSRRACAEPIYFNEDGTICEVKMTSQGASDSINAFSEIDASCTCRVSSKCYVAPMVNKDSEMLYFSGGSTYKHEWAEYKYINFDAGACSVNIKMKGNGKIYLKTENNYQLCEISVDSNDFKEYENMINKISEIHPMWILFEGSDIAIDSFCFK